jgi:hypothetical protein
MNKTYWEGYGFCKNPMYDDGEADYRFHAYTRKELFMNIKLMIDEMNIEHISIFRIGSEPPKEVHAQKTLEMVGVHNEVFVNKEE